MKFKDIKPGVAYAYRDRTYGSPEKIMFLAGAEGIRLYATAPFRAKPDDPAFTVSRESKPDSGRSDVWARRQAYGYPAVRGSRYGGDAPDLTAVTWDDFRKATVATCHDEDAACFSSSPGSPPCSARWDEVITAEDARAQEARAAKEEAVAADLDKQERASKVVDTLAADRRQGRRPARRRMGHHPRPAGSGETGLASRPGAGHVRRRKTAER